MKVPYSCNSPMDVFLTCHLFQVAHSQMITQKSYLSPSMVPPTPWTFDSSVRSLHLTRRQRKIMEGPSLEVYLLLLPTICVQMSIPCCYLTAREAKKCSLDVHPGEREKSAVNHQQTSATYTVLYRRQPVKRSGTRVPAQLCTCFPRETETH